MKQALPTKQPFLTIQASSLLYKKELKDSKISIALFFLIKKGANGGKKEKQPWIKLPLRESITDYWSSRIGISRSGS
jgi:hypothetical protein